MDSLKLKWLSKEVADKQAAQIAGQNAVWDSENVVNRNNVKRKDRKYLDY